MRTGKEFYSKRQKRVVQPGENIYLEELKDHLVERISFFRNAGCGAAGCNAEELSLRNELEGLSLFLNSNKGNNED
ncbi:MAG: hypothetical protein R6W90_16545 [Ignavibacteriaceae bacterium]